MLKTLAKRWIRTLAQRLGYRVVNTRRHFIEDGLITRHNPTFLTDPDFQAGYRRGLLASAGVDSHFQWRVHTALWAARVALRAPGDFVECGVNAGFVSSAILERLGSALASRRFYLIDTFSGPPLSQFSDREVALGRRRIAEEALESGAYVTDLERVRKNFSEWPNAIVVQGEVPAVLPSVNTGAVAFLHLDMNCAQPEQDALRFFWPRLSPGAVILLDDYAYMGHESQAAAIDSVAQSIGFEVLALPTGQGLVVKMG